MAISVETLILARKYADAVAAAGSEEALKKAVQEAVNQSKIYTDEVFSGVVSFKVEIVESLPLSDIDTHTIYFLKRQTPSGGADYYYEYMYINGLWEVIGSTELDLSNYWNKDQVIEYVDSQKYSLPVATETSLGGIKIDKNTMSINNEGVVSVSDAYTEQKAEDTAQKVLDDNILQIENEEIIHLF